MYDLFKSLKFLFFLHLSFFRFYYSIVKPLKNSKSVNTYIMLISNSDIFTIRKSNIFYAFFTLILASWTNISKIVYYVSVIFLCDSNLLAQIWITEFPKYGLV